MEDIVKKIEEKYKTLGQNPETYLEGLYHSKLITYWDYVEVDTLLSLQKPRTNFKDEEIFIMYHQVTELVLKLIIHELKQITEDDTPTVKKMIEKIKRINRYTGLLSNSFDIMSEGMDYDDYNQFRLTLAPASGFQSAQFSFIEIYCTDLINLVNAKGKERIPEDCSLEDTFQYIYWQDAGTNYKTGEKSLTLRLFEEKYLNEFKALANKMKENNLNKKLQKVDKYDPDYVALIEEARKFDMRYNIEWPIIHLGTANSYLNKKGENKRATGSSDWQKYLHPAYQQRKFFPQLYTQKEIDNWAKDML